MHGDLLGAALADGRSLGAPELDSMLLGIELPDGTRLGSLDVEDEGRSTAK